MKAAAWALVARAAGLLQYLLHLATERVRRAADAAETRMLLARADARIRRGKEAR